MGNSDRRSHKTAAAGAPAAGQLIGAGIPALIDVTVGDRDATEEGQARREQLQRKFLDEAETLDLD